jgi:hypothetical protein
MALFNHAAKELTAKIVYYGPGLSGKSTSLGLLHERLGRGAGKLLSLSTAQDRTIYFDLLPVELGNIKGYSVRFQVCTVPGQVFYNETKKLVLRGVDGLVFVVDSQWSMLSDNLECFQNLRDNLLDEKISLETLPVVVQYNKRDLPTALSVEALQDSLGFHSYPYVETTASEGTGVVETFRLASKLTFVDLLRRLQRGWQAAPEAPAPAQDEAAAVPEEVPVLSVSSPFGEARPPAAPEEAPPPPAPAAPPPATPPPVLPAVGKATSMDEKLNAVLAEARKSVKRVSGPHRRFESADGTAQDVPVRDASERRLEEMIAGLRAELQGEIAGLRGDLASAREAAARAEEAAGVAAERARRLEDALRLALKDLAP